jgi:hypothetical protein
MGNLTLPNGKEGIVITGWFYSTTCAIVLGAYNEQPFLPASSPAYLQLTSFFFQVHPSLV